MFWLYIILFMVVIDVVMVIDVLDEDMWVFLNLSFLILFVVIKYVCI